MKQLMAVTVTVLFLVVAALADSHDFARVKFAEDFYVGNTQMPAGDYFITCNSVNRTITFTERNGSAVVNVKEDDVLAKHELESTHFTFVRENGKLVLHRVAIQGDTHLHDIVHGSDIAELK